MNYVFPSVTDQFLDYLLENDVPLEQFLVTIVVEPHRWTGKLDASDIAAKLTLRPSVGVALRDLSSRSHGSGQCRVVTSHTGRLTDQCRSSTPLKKDSMRPDTEISIGIRTELFKAVAPDAAPPAMNTLDGRIAGRTLAGNLLHVYVGLDDGTRVVLEARPQDPLGQDGTAIRLG